MLTITRPVVPKKSKQQVIKKFTPFSPVAIDSRLGFEITSYAGSESNLLEFSAPVAIDSRLGFEITSYAGAN